MNQHPLVLKLNKNLIRLRFIKNIITNYYIFKIMSLVIAFLILIGSKKSYSWVVWHSLFLAIVQK